MEHLEEILLKEHKDLIEDIIEYAVESSKEGLSVPPLFMVFTESKNSEEEHGVIHIPIQDNDYSLLNDSNWKQFFHEEIKKNIKKMLEDEEETQTPYAFVMISQVWTTQLPKGTDINLSVEELAKIGEELGKKGEALNFMINTAKGTLMLTYDMIRANGENSEFVMSDTPRVSFMKKVDTAYIEQNKFVYF